jgi:hypothetical protein
MPCPHELQSGMLRFNGVRRDALASPAVGHFRSLLLQGIDAPRASRARAGPPEVSTGPPPSRPPRL